MVDATFELALDSQARSASLRYSLGRVAIYAFLGVFALIYLLPLFVVVANSFRELPEITQFGLIALPHSFSLKAWPQAWAHYCVAGTCEGVQRNFFNSLFMTIPATILSTLLGAMNGYVLSKWRFPASETLFICIVLGVFMPGQVALLPWAYILGALHLSNSVYGLILVHVIQGLSFTTLFCRNYYVNIPDDLIKAARIDGAGFWRIFFKIILPLSPPILIVTVIWQFTGIWNEFLFGVVFTGGTQQPITAALVALSTSQQSAHAYDVASAAVIIGAIPPLLIYLFGGKYFVRGLTKAPSNDRAIMATLTVSRLFKRFGSVEVLKGINLEAQTGEFIALVGPSGCGKSTLLAIIAGLETCSEGEIRIDGRIVNSVAPKDRDIAMVFQSYALYPTMTARQNMTFGMESRGVPKAEQNAAIARVAALLQIEPLLNRKPGQLSGGQRQRVAMGRALVRDPKLFLFDEPLSNLDAKLRVDMRTEIKKLHLRVGKTTIYVTHDQIEAMTLASRIAVMHQGAIQQFDEPQAVYDRPANMFVAGFMGSPSMNFIPGELVTLEGRTAVAIAVGQGETATLPLPQTLARQPATAKVVLGVRPEHMFRYNENLKAQKPGLAMVTAPVEVVEPTGAETHAVLKIGEQEIVGRFDPDGAPRLGELLPLGIDMGHACLFDPETQALISQVAA